MQPHTCNAGIHIQRSSPCTTEHCVHNADMHNTTQMPRCCLCNSPGSRADLLSVKISCVPIARSPLVHAGAFPPCSEVTQANRTSVFWHMGQLTHTMRPDFGRHFKHFVFHICPPCATTFLFFFSRRISGLTFNQPHREMRRMVPPRQRFIGGNTVRSFIFSLVVNKHTGLGPPLKGRADVSGAHSSSDARIGSLRGDGQRRQGHQPA